MPQIHPPGCARLHGGLAQQIVSMQHELMQQAVVQHQHCFEGDGGKKGLILGNLQCVCACVCIFERVWLETQWALPGPIVHMHACMYVCIHACVTSTGALLFLHKVLTPLSVTIE